MLIKKLPSLTIRHQSITVIIWLLVIFIYGCLIIYQIPDFIPIYSDEYFYYQNAKAFWLTSKTTAALTFDGNGSRIGGADAHGFMYPILYGSLGKIVGFGPKLFLLSNIFFLGLTLWLARKIRILSPRRNLIFSFFLLLQPMILLYSFTFMQEIIHLFFGFISLYFIYNIIQNPEEQNKISLILLLVFFSFFRATWIFWLWSLIPFMWSRKHYFTSVIFVVLPIFFSHLFQTFFFESVPGFYQQLNFDLKQGEFFKAIEQLPTNCYKNILLFFTYSEGISYSLTKLSYFLVWLFLGIISYKKNSYFYYGIWIVYTTHFILLITLYEAYGWKEIRSILAIFVISSFILFREFKKKQIIFFLFISLGGTISILPTLIRIHHFRKEIKASSLEKISDHILNQLEEETVKREKILIKVSENIIEEMELSVLPIETKNGKSIYYIIPYYPKAQKPYDFEIYTKTGDLKRMDGNKL